MTPEEKEVEQLDTAYHYALMEIGRQVVAESLTEWAATSYDNAASLGKYAAAATVIIMAWRRRARQLSVAHTRLVRALLTGATVEDPEFPGSGDTLGDLRRDFTELLAEYSVPRPLKARALPDSIVVQGERLPEYEERLVDRESWLDKELEDTFKILLHDDVQKKIEALPKSEEKRGPAEDKLDLDTGARITSAVERISLNGARENDADIIRFDKKAWGYVRVHDPDKTDHPCGFCSMLLTRGFVDNVIYNSEQSAQGSRYHTNCHCKAEKIYRSSQLQSEKYDEHRRLAKEWQRMTDEYGRSGPDLIHAWDKYIRSTKKVSPNKKSDEPVQDITPEAAQAAAA